MKGSPSGVIYSSKASEPQTKPHLVFADRATRLARRGAEHPVPVFICGSKPVTLSHEQVGEWQRSVHQSSSSLRPPDLQRQTEAVWPRRRIDFQAIDKLLRYKTTRPTCSQCSRRSHQRRIESRPGTRPAAAEKAEASSRQQKNTAASSKNAPPVRRCAAPRGANERVSRPCT